MKLIAAIDALASNCAARVSELGGGRGISPERLMSGQ
jgi:hypothetical protein